MKNRLDRHLMEILVRGFAGRDWSVDYLEGVASGDEGGAVTGATEHFDALRRLACVNLADVPPSPRFCFPDGFDDIS